MNHSMVNDLRLIEAGFPCHQVGAETQRERDTGKAPPPNRLHVWWARRPLTPSRAAILASLLPADTDPDWFLRQLGIEKRVVEINGVQWTLTGKILEKIVVDESGGEVLPVDERVLDLLQKEIKRREKNRVIIDKLKKGDPSLADDSIISRWAIELLAISRPLPRIGEELPVILAPADPAHINDRIAFAKSERVTTILNGAIKYDPEDLYGYTRAFANSPEPAKVPLTILDPTAGGGSIPFEALRLGHKVIANELNPVASVILHATLDYPARFGIELCKGITFWGEKDSLARTQISPQ